MLPMGTIVTVCMLLGVIFGMAGLLKDSNPFPAFASKVVGAIVLAAGCWNVFWYALQNLTQFWGIAALLSGSAMIITALYLLEFKLPQGFMIVRPLVLIFLLACTVLYAVTIYRL